MADQDKFVKARRTSYANQFKKNLNVEHMEGRSISTVTNKN